MSIVYKSVEDLANTIRQNLWKIPSNIDLIVGIPRSGMFCGILLSCMLNKPIMSLLDFLEGKSPAGGGRMKFIKLDLIKNVLILDDNVCSGRAIEEVKNTINSFKDKDKYNILYGCIYAEGYKAKDKVDIYLENNRKPNIDLYLYEWNIMHFDAGYTEKFMCDIDGIICKDPPDDRLNIEEYENYIKNPIQLIVPSRRMGAFVTYRLNKYRDITENWLKDLGVKYNQLYMVNANSYKDRARMFTPALYKSNIYGNASWARLFIESDELQAKEIAQITHKPVFCYANGRMY